MAWFNPLTWGVSDESYDEYDRGYAAAEEFIDLVDEDITDEQARVQWDVVESGHSQDYVNGYGDYIREESDRPWWKIW